MTTSLRKLTEIKDKKRKEKKREERKEKKRKEKKRKEKKSNVAVAMPMSMSVIAHSQTSSPKNQTKQNKKHSKKTFENVKIKQSKKRPKPSFDALRSPDEPKKSFGGFSQDGGEERGGKRERKGRREKGKTPTELTGTSLSEGDEIGGEEKRGGKWEGVSPQLFCPNPSLSSSPLSPPRKEEGRRRERRRRERGHDTEKDAKRKIRSISKREREEGQGVRVFWGSGWVGRREGRKRASSSPSPLLLPFFFPLG